MYMSAYVYVYRKKKRRRRMDAHLQAALVGYHETRPAEDEEEIAAAEAVEAGNLPGGDFSAGQVLVGSKDEQERLFQEAERDYEERMSKLADAQMAADGKVEQMVSTQPFISETHMRENMGLHSPGPAAYGGVGAAEKGGGVVGAE